MTEGISPRQGVTEQPRERSPFEFYKLSPAAKGRLKELMQYETVTSLVIDVLAKYPRRYLTSEDVFRLFPNDKKSKAGGDNRNLYNAISEQLEYLVKENLAVTKGATIYGKRGIRK